MAGKGGGAWKVAYADFVTAMMAFFMVMWLTSQSPKMKEALAEHFRDPPGVFDFDKTHTGHSGRKKGQRTDSPTPSFTPPPVDLDSQPKSSVPRLLLKRDHDEQHVGTILAFAHGAAELDETASAQLRELAVVAAGKSQKIEIRGHASRRPLPAESPYRDAWQLSYARCVTAMEFLREQGIAANRLRLSQAGSGEPFSVLPSSATESHDGRVEVFLLAEFADDGARFDAPPAEAEKSHGREPDPGHGNEAAGDHGHEAEHAPPHDHEPKSAHDEHQSAHE